MEIGESLDGTLKSRAEKCQKVAPCHHKSTLLLIGLEGGKNMLVKLGKIDSKKKNK